MSMEVHHSHVLKEGAGSGWTVISPEIPAPAPNQREDLIFTEHHQKKPPKISGPKSCPNRPDYSGPARCVYVVCTGIALSTLQVKRQEFGQLA